MMSFDNTLFRQDAAYYEYVPGMYLPGTMIPDGPLTWSRRAVDAAINVDLRDSDAMIATYPKTGE